MIAASVAASALLLTGCQGSPSPAASASGSARPTASDPSATASASAKPSAKAVKLTCDQVITPDQVSKLVPSVAPVSGFTPEKGSDAAKAVSYSGVACGLSNASSGNTTAVAVATPASDDLTALKNKAITGSNVVPTYGVPPKVMGYFAVTAGVGVAEAFTGKYWVVAESKDYLEPGDASQVMAAVLANLPA
jgi:hypothetical protein